MKLRRFWETSNFRILRVPGNGGTLQSVACSKALFVGMDGGSDSWSQQAVHLPLPPKHHQVRPLEPRKEAKVTEYFQPRLQMFRFRHLQVMRESGSAACKGEIARFWTRSTIVRLLGEAPDIIKAVTPLLQSQEQDALARRSCDPTLALAEVIWTVLHDGQKEATITRIAELANVLLHSRGETLDHSPEELGWKLRNLGLYRKRGRNGMVLRFDRQTVRRIHELARQFALEVQPVEGCRDCTEAEGTAG